MYVYTRTTEGKNSTARARIKRGGGGGGRANNNGRQIKKKTVKPGERTKALQRRF